MSLAYWWRWWRALPNNPIYLREKGGWGTPNPFYATLMRYSPFLLIGAILTGLCSGTGGSFLNGNETLLAAACFLCIPNFLLTAVSLYGSLIVPALTAPAISMEMDRGTWEILRVTPLPTIEIVLAKMLGALSRLRIWLLLLALSAIQGGLSFLIMLLFGQETAVLSPVIGFSVFIRPWLEIFFAAGMGMYLSLRTRSAVTALVGTYGLILAVKLVNNSAIWSVIFLNAFNEPDWVMTLATTAGPTAVYASALILLVIGLVHQAKQLEAGVYE